jgi:hypothetical protein
VAALAERCRGGNAALEGACREAALVAQGAHAAAGLLASGGAPVPGAASTIGRRFGGTPRIAVSLRGGTAHFSLPDVGDATPAGGESHFGFGTHAVVAAGLLDGFSPRPTVGGVLSLDVFAGAGALFLPGDAGFDGSAITWGGGVNVGLLRESFTLPGVTLSLAYRGIGELELGDRSGGDALEVSVDPSVTSLRGLIGKDLLALGVLAGVGWDRYASDALVVVPGPASASGDLDSGRLLLFGGVSVNLLLVQFSAEGGWAGGLDDLSGRPSSGYDPGDASLFLSVAGRLTL